MITITKEMLKSIAGPIPKSKQAKQDRICQELADAINTFGAAFDLHDLMNLSRFLGQCCVESDSFCTTTEYASGRAYEGRADLGNTQPGDGPRFRGQGLIQTTGRYNFTAFNGWAHIALRTLISAPIPDFVENPKKVAEYPYAFFSAVYYWQKHKLNTYAQQGNDEMLTKKINGGRTHLERRINHTTKAQLVLLGYRTSIDDIRRFQRTHGLVADGIIGRLTRVKLDEVMRAGPYVPGIPQQGAPVPAPEAPAQTNPEPKKEELTISGLLVTILKLIFTGKA